MSKTPGGLSIPGKVSDRLAGDPSLLRENLPPPSRDERRQKPPPAEPPPTSNGGDFGDGFYGGMPLREAAALVIRERRRPSRNGEPAGIICPCCEQRAHERRLQIGAAMARGLITHYRLFGGEFGYIMETRRANEATDNWQESKLRFWDLFEEETERRADGGRKGWWRVTEGGMMFVTGKLSVPRYVWVYNNQRTQIEQGERWTISDALGEPFDYGEYMRHYGADA